MHKGLAPVPADYGSKKPSVPCDLIKEAALAYDIATEDEIKGATTACSVPKEDFNVEPEHSMEYITEDSSEPQIVEDTD